MKRAMSAYSAPLVVAAGLAVLLTYLEPWTRTVSASERGAPRALELPARSLYRLGSRWLTDDERSVELSSLQGQHQIVALMFTRCPTVCPTLVQELRAFDAKLPRDVATATRFVLISIDPEHDTPAALRAYRRKLGLDPSRFVLLRGETSDVRELGALLGFAFSSEGNMPSAHSRLITLLSPAGEVLLQQSGVAEDPERFVQLIRGQR